MKFLKSGINARHGTTIFTTTAIMILLLFTAAASSANEPPEAENDNYTVVEGRPLHIWAPGVLDNDADPDGDSLFAVPLSSPLNGQLFLDPDGSFTYTHDGGDTLIDSFTYKASDGLAESTASVFIDIIPSDLTAHWNMDGTNAYILQDVSGFNHHAEIYGAIRDDNGVYLRALDFLGDDKRVDLPGALSDYATDQFTVMMWINPTESRDENYLFIAGDNHPGMFLDGDNKVGFRYKTGVASAPRPGESEGFWGDPAPPGQWMHVACSWNGSAFKGYVNGRLVGAVQLLSFDFTGEMLIGKSTSAPDTSFNGRIDDARIYERALSEGEIHEIAGLSGHWKFDEFEGDVVEDSSPFQNSGENVGAARTTQGLHNYALDFSEDGARVLLSGEMGDYVTDHFTVMAWAKLQEDQNKLNYIFHAFDDRPGISLTWENKILFSYKGAPDHEPLLGEDSGVEGPVQPVGQWIHLACTWNGTTYTGYVNGEAVGSVDLPYFQLGGRIYIGKCDGSGDRSFEGLIDDTRIYHRALSQTEIKRIARVAGDWKFDETGGFSALDSSTYGHHGMIRGPVTTVAGRLDRALDFTGDGNYVKLPNKFYHYVEDAFSVMMWVYPNASKTYNYIFHASDDMPGILLDGSNNVGFRYKGNEESEPLPGPPCGISGGPIPLNEWRHLACTWDGATYRAYIDGAPITPVDLPFFNLGGRIVVGKADGGDLRSFEGLIDEVRIYHDALPESEILTIANATTPPHDPIQPPGAVTGAASDGTADSVVLNGSVNPNGTPTYYYFEYGETTDYGFTTDECAAGSGRDFESAPPLEITGLDPYTTYHYRLVASNVAGVVHGEDQTFRTLHDGGNQKAIIVAGGGMWVGNTLWTATSLCSNFAYKVLLEQGFTKENIYYLSPDLLADVDGNGALDDVDADATLANLENALKVWALDAEDLFLYITDHGGNGFFKMNETELLWAGDFDDWLDETQATVPGDVGMVYDACRSASFIAHLDPPPGKSRIIVASADVDELAMFPAHGTLSFSFLFWGNMYVGNSFYDSYVDAKNGIRLAFSRQHSQIEGNGNGVPNEDEDKALARNFRLGAGNVYGGDMPYIGEISPWQVLNNTSTALIYAEDVVDADGIDRVWMVVTPPDYIPSSPDDPITDLPTIDLNPVG
ncbi:MAG: hypothetical protein GY859_22835, partial [Desulfobacterales bacterium]|nr:hypothetical protein [Desulfobacterales bacterium]